MVVKKGTTLTLECNASGNPVPTISWSRKVCTSIITIIILDLIFDLFMLVNASKEENN